MSKGFRELSWAPIMKYFIRIEEAVKEFKGGVVNLASGSPDVVPRPEEVMDAISDVASRYWGEVVSYPPPGGPRRLRDEVRAYLASQGVDLGGMDLLVFSGSMHALNVLSLALIRAGDLIASENPTFTDSLIPMKLHGASVRPIALTPSGLEGLARGVEGVKALYVVPTANNPTGMTYSAEARSEIAELSSEHSFLVIEDDPYRALASTPPPPIVNYCRAPTCVYVGSFSKVLAPGFRVAYVAVPKELSEVVMKAGEVSLALSSLASLVVYALLRKGLVARYAAEGRRRCELRLKALVDALRDYMPYATLWAEPRGGFYAFIKVPGVNMDKVLDEALRRGVSYVPGPAFYLDSPDLSTARLSIAKTCEDDIVRGVKALSEAVKSVAPGPIT